MIATLLDKAAKAVRKASDALEEACSAAPELQAIDGIGYVDRDMADELETLAWKYQEMAPSIVPPDAKRI